VFLHRNECIIWRDKSKIITLKFFLIGEIKRPNGGSFFIRRSRFWDSSVCSDPTKRVLIGAQFSFFGISPDELKDCRVDIATDKGLFVDYVLNFQNENCITLEYRSYRPMTVNIKNYMLNRTIEIEYKVRWFRRPHNTLSNEYIFVLYVEKEEQQDQLI